MNQPPLDKHTVTRSAVLRNFKLITLRNERQFRALTGLSQKEFDRLLAEFTQALESAQPRHYKKHQLQHQRKPGGGRKGALSTPELKLFFILFYLKSDPTFEVLGGLFDGSPANAQEKVIKLLAILKQAEKSLRALPPRHFKPSNDNPQDTDKKQKIIIDATERSCSRPRHARKQKHYYRGKKHAHTVKNTVSADGNKGIPVMGPTAPGSRHDYALLKEELDPTQPGLSSVEVSVDLGYQGIKERYPNFHKINIPHKKPRKSTHQPNPTLTPKQKKENRVLSRTRVAVEHLIGDLKVFHSLAIKFRSHIESIADQVILWVAGLCNLKNEYVVQ